MAAFFTSLFESIFTPGPTPTLVAATNASFAALQAVLLGLLIATYSVHFCILSVLCGGLWLAINWFVREMEAAKAREGATTTTTPKTGEDKGAGDSSGTETEEERPAPVPTSRAAADVGAAAAAPAAGGKPGASGASLMPGGADRGADQGARKRRSLGDVSGTDSEWDKMESEFETDG